MKRFSILGCIAAALLSLAGCEPSGNDDSMTNYIYLSSDKTSMFEIDNEPIVVEVMLRNSLTEDVELTFALNDNSGIVRLENNPVLIPAGEKTGYLKIYPGSGDLAATTNYTVSLDATVELTADLTLQAPFTFALVPVNVEPLTDEQNAIIAAYKAETGIDLAKFMGIVGVSTEITGLEFNSEEEFTKTVTGKTLITLSEEATADMPVLKMLANPMGIQDHMYGLLRKMTVENYEFWFPEGFEPVEGEENPFAMYETLCNTISWNADSKEVFSMSLDNIVFNADESVEFVHEYYQPYNYDPEHPENNESISVVPFAYEFTAYDREKAAIESETLLDNSANLCTANPEYYFNYTGILEDEWEAGYGNFAEPKAEITEDGKLVFTFCFDYCGDYCYDYTRVVATYTPNN